MKAESSLPRSQEPTTCPCPERDPKGSVQVQGIEKFRDMFIT